MDDILSKIEEFFCILKYLLPTYLPRNTIFYLLIWMNPRRKGSERQLLTNINFTEKNQWDGVVFGRGDDSPLLT